MFLHASLEKAREKKEGGGGEDKTNYTNFSKDGMETSHKGCSQRLTGSRFLTRFLPVFPPFFSFQSKLKNWLNPHCVGGIFI